MYIPFGLQDFVVDHYGQPGIALENWFAEPSPELPNRPAKLVPTPGLVASGGTITGAPGAVFQSSLLFGSDAVISAGTTVYRRTAAGVVSTVASSLASATIRPKFAATQFPELVLVQGGAAYLIETTGATEITIAAASGDIIDVTVAGQRHLFVEAASGRVHISDAADASTVDKFITAEGDPDPALAIEEFANDIYVFGSITTQVARLTGDDVIPLAFVPRTVPRGIFGSRTYAKGAADLFFVGDDNRVYRMNGGVPVDIGTSPISRLLSEVAPSARDGVTMGIMRQMNTEFVLLTIPSVGQYVYDIKTQLWHRRKRLNEWHGGIGPIANIDGGVFCLEEGSTSGQLIQLVPSTYTDKGTAIRRVATAPLPMEDGSLNIRSVSVECFTGAALDGIVQGSDPLLMFRVAKDGQVYGQELTRSVGKLGQYRQRVIFGPLGMFYPGMPMFQIAISDPVGLTVTGAIVNPSSRR